MLFENRIGCHLSIKGSVLNIFQEAKDLNIYSIACFTGSSLRYNFNVNFDANIILQFRKKISEGYLVYSHACYLINIADESKKDNYNKSIQAILAEFKRCSLLGIKGIAFHPGSNENRYDGLLCIAKTINNIFENNDVDVELYIESSAGEGNKIPTFLHEIKIIFDNLSDNSKKMVGFVLDTCHIFAAGYDFSSKALLDNFLINFDKIVGIEKIKLIHLNDSKKECGSKLDRHETIGKGFIGIENIINLVNISDFNHIAKILETPVNNYLDWKSELSVLDNLLKK